jgi:3-oxoacyl-[acyl-carrier-protein] synthase III
MKKDALYLSLPIVKHGKNNIDNNYIINRVSENFKGTPLEWQKIKIGISHIFKYCDTKTRFFGVEKGKKVIDYVIDAAREVCTTNGIPTYKVDLLIYGGIYRDYFEPATSMEIASKIGLKKVAAFDVLDACAGLMQAVHVAYSMMKSDHSINLALCCSADFPEEAINFDIQSFKELTTKSAGLTIGSGASAWLISRYPLKTGGAEIVDIKNTSIPKAYDICKVPVQGSKFESKGRKIFDLGVNHIPNEIKNILARVSWSIEDISYFITHQPSRKIIQEICDILAIPYDKSPVIHHLYGNTVNSSIPMTMDYIKNNSNLKTGDKLIFNAAGAGFSMVTAAATWAGNEE